MNNIFVMSWDYRAYYDFLRNLPLEYKTSGYIYVYLNDLDALRGISHVDIIKLNGWENNIAYTDKFCKELEHFHTPNYINCIYPIPDPILELFSKPL
jgi:hypothetical protein